MSTPEADAFRAFEDGIDPRQPEPVTGTGAEQTRDLLGGLEAHFRPVPDWKDENDALALLAVRRACLRHPCTSGPGHPCDHPDHPRDMAILRGDLEKLDLPMGTELLPLAFELKRREQQRKKEKQG